MMSHNAAMISNTILRKANGNIVFHTAIYNGTIIIFSNDATDKITANNNAIGKYDVLHSGINNVSE